MMIEATMMIHHMQHNIALLSTLELSGEDRRKLELVLGYIRGKFPPNSNCCFWQRDISGSIITTWMMMAKNVPSSMGKTY